jgi:vancomycin resistance protein YoaR
MAKKVNRLGRAFYLALFCLLLAVACTLTTLALLPPRAALGTAFSGERLEAMTRDEALRAFRRWWAVERDRAIAIESHFLSKNPPPQTLETLGVEPDFDAMLAQVRFQSVVESWFGGNGMPVEVRPRYKAGVPKSDYLSAWVAQHALPAQPARVFFRDGKVVRQYEVTSFEFDESLLAERAAETANEGRDQMELPMRHSATRIPREALDSIVDVMASFTTKFNAGQVSRSSNIRLAAKKLDGIVLMPGEVLSYNETVGKRTASQGFKPAGVYANGRHEVDYGGGICQVSTTLFNAALLANLKIVSRQNHSMPVPYVPVGRDATVDYGSIDLKIQNPFDHPIAISSEVKGGTVTFRVLGRKHPDVSVSIVVDGHSSWGTSIRYVDDPSLDPGTTVVVEPGSTGRRCVTWRIVRRNGEVVARERIGESVYRAWPRIVRRGPSLPTAVANPPGGSEEGAVPPPAEPTTNASRR